LAVGLAGLAAVWAVKRCWRMASICGVCAAANAVLVLLVLLPVETMESQAGIRLRLVSINVHTENERSDLVLKFLQTADADVILLMEVNEAWMNAMQPLRTNYTQVIADPREDNFGIALFSRLPLTNSEVIELGKAEVPSIATTISVGGQRVFLLGTHPLPPGSAEYARLRNDQLQEIGALIRHRGMAAIVLGDLNCTPWSPYFTDLLRDSGLKNTSQRRGLFGSWPAWLPLARIPLDHGLVSQTIRVIEKRVGPPVGSDHLPLVLELQISTEDRVHVPPDQGTQAHD
jgi:endonuclease/exonuclease/phosphatase (EEP) superfamily protein YafD